MWYYQTAISRRLWDDQMQSLDANCVFSRQFSLPREPHRELNSLIWTMPPIPELYPKMTKRKIWEHGHIWGIFNYF